MRQGIEICPSRPELLCAAIEGVRRHLIGLDSAYRNAIANPDFDWGTDIDSAIAEMVVAKAHNWYWCGIGDFGADVNGYEARHTAWDNGGLILRPGQVKPEARYYLVTGKAPRYTVRGWILGRDGAIARFEVSKPKNGGPPYWLIPQDDDAMQRVGEAA